MVFLCQQSQRYITDDVCFIRAVGEILEDNWEFSEYIFHLSNCKRQEKRRRGSRNLIYLNEDVSIFFE